MRRRFHFPPGEFPAAAPPRLSQWRVVQLHRIDLIIAIYGSLALSARLWLWQKVLRALTEAKRKRVYSLDKYQQLLAELLNLTARQPNQGARNALF
jgi:hypothetical protein